MANANGGDIVYGVEEVDGGASTVISLHGEVPDTAARRLLQILDAGIEPRVTGVVLRQIATSAGYVLLIRVPASYDGPHCIRVNANRRFVTRNGTSTADMSYDQIRSAFDRTATLAERSRRFIAERLDAVAQRKTPMPVMAGPTWVFHIVPLSGIAERRSVNLREIYHGSFTNFIGKDWSGGGRSFNFDEVWIDAIEQTDVDDALRPSLDMIWQAFGQDRCLDFDETSGKYSPRRGIYL